MKENSQDNSSLTLRMEYFIREAGHEVATCFFHGRQLATQSVIKSLKLGHHHLMNQVRQVLVQSCSNLRLGLDLVIQSTILPTCFNQGNAAKTFQHRNNLTHPPLMKEFPSKLFQINHYCAPGGSAPHAHPVQNKTLWEGENFIGPGSDHCCLVLSC